MSEKVLFVLEGASKEPKVIDALWPLAHSWAGVSCPPKTVYTFCTHIYTLFRDLKADPDLDLLGLLKEMTRMECCQMPILTLSRRYICFSIMMGM